MKPVAILGGGLAGLVAARELKRKNIPAIVFEAAGAIGGMASSYKDESGFTYDMGAHFVSNRLADALGASDSCLPVPHYGEAVLAGRRNYDYPLGLIRSPRYVGGAIISHLYDSKIENAADWFTHAYGKALADEVAIPLAEAWSGVNARDLAPRSVRRCRAAG